jgi:hypothetical protein
MRRNRPNWPAMLVIVGILMPGSFVSATIVVDFFIFARNFESQPSGTTPPVEPLLAAFQFFVEDSGAVTTNQAILSFGSFEPADFRASFFSSSGGGVNYITTSALTPAADGFHYSGMPGTRFRGSVAYTTWDTDATFGTVQYAWGDDGMDDPPDINIIIRTQVSVSPS